MKRWQQSALLFFAGALQVAAFAPLDVWPLSFLSLATLFFFWREADSRQAAWQGFAWGLGCFLVGISWVYVSMHNVGGMAAPIAAAMTALFASYLALYPALAGWLAARLRGSLLQPLLIAAAWALSEWLRGTIATGFPWLAIGYSQIDSPLAGYAPLVGVYGVSFITALAAALLMSVFVSLRSERRMVWASLVLCVFVFLGGTGLRQVSWTQPQGESFTVSLLQGNVPQSLKWDPQRLSLSLQGYAELARKHPADLLVLPETAIPLMFDQIPQDYLQSLLRGERHLLLGAAVGLSARGDELAYANGAVMLAPNLQHSAYLKQHLVPFGEFVPTGFSWFLELMNIPMSGFTPGHAQQAPLNIAGQRIMPNICYEDLFGEEIIRALPEATLLVNLSNTAWFGDSLAQPQHLQIAQMRALETGRMMLRATNTGMTAVIQADGRVTAVLPAFSQGGLTVQAQGYTGATPYVRIGNWAIITFSLLVLGLGAYRLRSRRAGKF